MARRRNEKPTEQPPAIDIVSRIQRIESFQVVMSLVVNPMLFLSGAIFPLQRLPGWLGVAVKVNPATYGVDPIRRVILGDKGALSRRLLRETESAHLMTRQRAESVERKLEAVGLAADQVQGILKKRELPHSKLLPQVVRAATYALAGAAVKDMAKKSEERLSSVKVLE